MRGRIPLTACSALIRWRQTNKLSSQLRMTYIRNPAQMCRTELTGGYKNNILPLLCVFFFFFDNIVVSLGVYYLFRYLFRLI
ncbi:hypothetical protein EA14781_026_00170 [Escherichia albertii NBRC 107761 = DSM 17582]|nr:hypothetical protein EA14781_026_00170 [Escherichia albertii NBRC 107761 = DSM 17582]